MTDIFIGFGMKSGDGCCFKVFNGEIIHFFHEKMYQTHIIVLGEIYRKYFFKSDGVL